MSVPLLLLRPLPAVPPGPLLGLELLHLLALPLSLLLLKLLSLLLGFEPVSSGCWRFSAETKSVS